MSIRVSGMPLVDLTHNGDEVGPNDVVKGARRALQQAVHCGRRRLQLLLVLRSLRPPSLVYFYV
jgi:hypothetical protein